MSADVPDRASASSPVAPSEVTRLLRPWGDGDRSALDRKARIIEAHIPGGLTCEETAAPVGVSAATVDRELHLANAWLARALAEDRS